MQKFYSLNKGNSWHFYRTMNEEGIHVDKKHEWTRPCFKNYKMVIVGDSSLRSFGRRKKAIEGVSITGFGGLDILELICMLRAGRLSSDVDFDKVQMRNRHQAGRDVFATVRFCTHCFTECMESFEGDLILVIGLNNVLNADGEQNVKRGQNQQNFPQLFARLEETIQLMIPNAKTTFATPLVVPKYIWAGSGRQQAAYASIVREIEKRNHLQMDTEEPRKLKQYDQMGVHMWDIESVEYWMNVLRRNNLL